MAELETFITNQF